MTRVITIAGTAITSTSDLDSIVVGGQAKQGDSALSEMVLYDDSNALFGASEAFIRKQWSVTEDASGTAVYLARGRIAAFETHRGDEDSVQGTKVQYSFALEDQNLELRGHDVNDWERPEETGYARVTALGTAYLNGSPRTSTNLNTTTYVPNSNTVTMPAKTYVNADAIDVITECAAAEDKKFFVTVDHELFYDLESSTAYATILEISDGVGSASDPDGTNYFAPIWDMGSALSWEGQDYASRVRLAYNQDSSVIVTDSTSESAHDRWVAHVADTETTSAAMATAFATAELSYRKSGERTYALALKIPAAQAYKIKVGQVIWIQAQAAVDTTARVQRRIAELMWEPDGPYWYIARLNLDRPVRRRVRGSVSGATLIGPHPAPVCEDDEIVSPTTIWSWTWTTDELDDGTSTYDGGLDRTVSGGFGDYAPALAAFGSGYGRNNASAYVSQKVPISASTEYSFRLDILYRYTPANRDTRLSWYSGGGALLRTDLFIDGSGHAIDTAYHEVATFTSPVGAATVQIDYSNFAGVYADNMFIETPGSIVVADNDPYCLVDPGESPYYMRSDDPRVLSLEEQVAALEAEDNGGPINVAHLSTATTFPIIAHRGDMNPVDGYPEDTIEAMRQAMTKGAHGIEFDVIRDADGVWQVIHDTTVDRTTDGTGTVASKTTAQMAALNIDGGHGYDAGRHGTTLKVPTLDEMIEAVLPYDPILYFDLKDTTTTSHEALAQYIVDNNLVERSILLGLTLAGVEAAHAVETGLETQIPAVIDSNPQNYDYIDRVLTEQASVTNAAYVNTRNPDPVDAYIDADTHYGDDETTYLTQMWERGVRAYLTNDVPNALLLRNEIVLGITTGVAALDDLSDVTITSVTSGDILRHNGTAFVNVDEQAAGHWEVIVSGTAPPVAVTNEAEDDWVYGWVSG